PAGVLAGLRTAYEQVRDQVGRASDISLGIGVPGVVSGGVVAHAVNLGLDSERLDLAAAARALGAARVVVENDVKAAAWGAAHWLRRTCGPGHGQDLALINVGTGLAAGLVLDGTLRRGSKGLAGEIGHLVTDRHGPPCPCGKRGCLELSASGGGLARRWPGSAAELMSAAAAGDPAAVPVRDDLVAGLAQAVQIIVKTTDVAEVALAGGVITSTPALREAVLAELGARSAGSAFEQSLATTERIRWLPDDYPAGSVGAALLPPTPSPASGLLPSRSLARADGGLPAGRRE